MQPTDGQQGLPAFPKLPKSALFSRLEAFLPAMAEENKRLEEAVAAGHGDEHNIEVEEAADSSDSSEEESEDEDEDENMKASDETAAKNSKKKKKQIIEMNFALGVMEDGNSSGSDSDSSDEEQDGDKALQSALSAAKAKQSDSAEHDEAASDSFRLHLSRPSHKPKPVIQELN